MICENHNVAADADFGGAAASVVLAAALFRSSRSRNLRQNVMAISVF
jgi:membrane associated rhomboid family serine protease